MLAAFGLSLVRTVAEGIPEPSLVLYGVIQNASNNTRVTVGTLEWTFQPAGGGQAITATVTLQNINDQFSYVLRVPCESLIAGQAASPNTLALAAPPTTYDRSQVRVNGQAARLVLPALATLTLAKTDRGRIERVDLQFSVATIDADGNGLPDDWERAFFNRTGANPADDPDKDGMSNFAEFKAGTDPNNFQSQFAVIKVEALPQGGLKIEWSSAPGRTYAVLRSGQVTGGFTPIKNAIAATPPLNAFQDATATGDGPFFYLLKVEE